MPVSTTPQAIILGEANYYQVTSIAIRTPLPGSGNKLIFVNYAACQFTPGNPNANPPTQDMYTILREFQVEIGGVDLLTLAGSAPVGSNVNAVIKHSIYAYLQGKGLIPEGEAV